VSVYTLPPLQCSLEHYYTRFRLRILEDTIEIKTKKLIQDQQNLELSCSAPTAVAVIGRIFAGKFFAWMIFQNKIPFFLKNLGSNTSVKK
jgi:hypothetical protein